MHIWFQVSVANLRPIDLRGRRSPDTVPGLTSTDWGAGQKTERRQTASGATAQHR